MVGFVVQQQKLNSTAQDSTCGNNLCTASLTRYRQETNLDQYPQFGINIPISVKTSAVRILLCGALKIVLSKCIIDKKAGHNKKLNEAE